MSGPASKFRALFLATLVAVSAVTATAAIAGTAAAAGNTETLHVAADGSAEYSSIQSAVDAASPGDTVRVASGTYDETVTVDVADVAVEGPNAGTPGDGDRVAEATVEGQVAIEGDGVVFDGFDVTPPNATTNADSEALRIGGSADDVVVRNNVVRDFGEDSIDEWEGVDGIVAFGGDANDAISNVTIIDNRVSRIAGRDTAGGVTGISIQGNVDGATVTDNVVTDIGMDETAWAFGLVARPTGNHEQVPTSVELRNNDVNDVFSNPNTDTVGVGIGIGEESNQGIFADASETTVKQNSVTDVELLVENKDTNHALDATRNWWGDANGPATAENPQPTDAASIGGAGDVTYTPWLDAPADRGGEPTAPVENLDQGTFSLSVQDAVDAANAGDRIEVGAGTYKESVTVDVDGLTLRAADGDRPTILGDGTDAGTQPHAAIHVPGNGPTTSVTIEGLRIRNPDGHYGIYAGEGGSSSDVDGLEVRNNVIEDVGTDLANHDPLAGSVAGLYVRAQYDGITVADNLVRNVDTTGDNHQNAVGLSFSSFTGDEAFAGGGDSGSETAANTVVRDNTVTAISGAESSRAKGISVSGEFDGLTIAGNTLTDVTTPTSDGTANAISLTENPPKAGSDIDGDGTDERVGPRNFVIRDNVVAGVTAPAPSALFVGGYEDLGGEHAVVGNDFLSGTVSRYAGAQDGYDAEDGDTLNATRNYFDATTGPNGAIDPPELTESPETLPDGDGILVFTNGEDANGDPVTGKIDVSPWLRSPSDVYFSTAITNVDDTAAGGTLTVDARIENTGTETYAQTVVFEVDGDRIATETVELTGGESRTVQFSYGTSSTGTLDVTVSTVDDVASASSTVSSPPDNDPTSDGSETDSGGTTDDETALDADPDATDEAPVEGTTAEFDGTEQVESVTFEAADVDGSVEVAEYADPPETVEAEVVTEVTDDADEAEVVSVVDVSPTAEGAEERAATVELTVAAAELDDPESAVVAHETDDGWERLETTVADAGGAEVTLTAETDSFSLFAVVETEESTETTTTTPGTTTATLSDETTDAPSDETTAATTSDGGDGDSSGTEAETSDGGGLPGFTAGAAVLALAGALVALRRRR